MPRTIIKFIVIISLLQITHAIGLSPKGEDFKACKGCDDFSRNARFNPNSVLDHNWIAFYFWKPHVEKMVLQFIAPTTKELNYVRYVLDTQVAKPINWTAENFLMKDLIKNLTYLVVKQDDRGKYFTYVYGRGKVKTNPVDVRYKQTSDNKYLGMMSCELKYVWILARKKDIPPKNKIQSEAARLGYRGLKGKSYLYQGHEWMPIPEAEHHEMGWLDKY